MRRVRSVFTFLVFAVVAFLAGCATLPSPEKMQTETAEFRLPGIPDPEKAMVYVVRPSFLGTVIRFNVFVDTQEPASEMGYTRGAEYIYFQVTPGDHTIYSKAENWAETVVSLKAGEIAYLRQDPTMGFLMARNSLLRIDDVVGRYYVKTLTQGTILQTASASTQKSSGGVDAAFATKIQSAFSSDTARAAAASPGVRPDSASLPRQVPGEPVPRTDDPELAWIPRDGDRFIYSVALGSQVKGRMAVEVIGSRDKRVKERLVWLPTGTIAATRDVQAGFSAERFLAPVIFPGSYQLLEFAPYPQPEIALEPGKRWVDVPGEVIRYQIGKTTVRFAMRVIGRETVNVPAGRFDAYHIEAKAVAEGVNSTILRITADYWYAPKIRRTVRMTLRNKTDYDVIDQTETYELAAVESGARQ